MRLYKGSLFWITVSAQDEVAVIYQEWQAPCLPAPNLDGADLSGPCNVYFPLCLTHLFSLEHGYCGDVKPHRESGASWAVKCSGKSTHLGPGRLG